MSRKTTTRNNRRRLVIEALEDRRLLSANVILQDGFESGAADMTQWDEVSAPAGNLTYERGVAHSGNYSARIRYAMDESSAHMVLLNRSFEEGVYVRFWQMYPQGFTQKNLKQVRLFHAEGGSYQGSFTASLWSNPPEILSIFYGGMDNDGRDAVYSPFTVPAGQWFKTALYIKYNTPGQNNGLYRLWRDDKLVVSYDDIVWRTNNEGANGLWVGGNYSGGGIDPVPFDRYLDDIYIATEPDIISEPPTPAEYRYYEGSWDRLPNFASLTPVAQGFSDLSLDRRLRNDNFGFQFQTTLTVPMTGDYTFYLGSDDGSRLKIDNQVVVDNDGLHAYLEKQAVIRLTAGEHRLGVEFFENGGEEILTLEYAGPGFGRQAIPAAALKRPTTPPPAGIIEFDVASRTVNETDGTVTLVVTRHDGSSGAVAVDYTTRDGTAIAGQDFTGTSGRLQFAAGETSKTIVVGLRTDALSESNETFTVDLTGVSGGATLGARKSAVVAIRDVPPNRPPAVVTPPAATLQPDGRSAVLSVLGGDDSGAALRYTWTVIAMPPGAPRPPEFGLGNGTTAGRNLPVTFFMAGTYTFGVTITDADGLTATSTLSFTVPARLAAIQITPAVAKVKPKGHLQFSAQTVDQFGNALNTKGSFSWSVSSGKITKSGYFTASGTSKPVTVTVKKGTLQAKVYVTVSSK